MNIILQPANQTKKAWDLLDLEEQLAICKVCPHVEMWGNDDYGYKPHCKLIRYRDHTGTSAAAPCEFLTPGHCPLDQTSLEQYHNPREVSS